MTETPTRPRRRPKITTVLETEHLSPHLVRVVVGGEDLDGFGVGEFTDHYVKLHIPPPGAEYDAPFDTDEVKERYPREQWPRVRTYTVREWDPEQGRLTIDFVVHGDEGVAGPWAAGAKPGDVLQLMGPGGGYAPSPDAAWHLMVGDLAAVPAIAASLRRVPAGAPVHVIIEVPGPEDEIALETPGEPPAHVAARRRHRRRAGGRGPRPGLPRRRRPRVRARRGRRHARDPPPSRPRSRRPARVDVRVRLLEGRPRRRGVARREGGLQPRRRRRARSRSGLREGPHRRSCPVFACGVVPRALLDTL